MKGVIIMFDKNERIRVLRQENKKLRAEIKELKKVEKYYEGKEKILD